MLQKTFRFTQICTYGGERVKVLQSATEDNLTLLSMILGREGGGEVGGGGEWGGKGKGEYLSRGKGFICLNGLEKRERERKKKGTSELRENINNTEVSPESRCHKVWTFF